MPIAQEELMRTALRVLWACTSHRDPDATDVERLRAAAGKPEPDDTPDALARQIVERELERKRGFDAAG
jgi:hypothetical protein